MNETELNRESSLLEEGWCKKSISIEVAFCYFPENKINQFQDLLLYGLQYILCDSHITLTQKYPV